MAQILPYQRQTTDAPGLGVTPSPGGIDYIAQGLSGIANGLGNFGAVMKERDDKAKAAQSALALATYNNDMHDAHDQVAQGVQDGSIPIDQAVSKFRESATKIKGDVFGGLSAPQQADLLPHTVTTSGGLERNLSSAVFQRQQSEVAGTIDAFGEQAQRSAAIIGPAAAAEKFAAFVDFTGDQAGLSPERQSKIKQSFSENVHYSAFQTAGVDALTKGDAPRLAEIRTELNGPNGAAIDPAKRGVLTHQLFGYEQHVLAQQAAAENRAENEARLRDNAAGDLYNKAFDIAVQGKQFEPAFIKQMTEAAAGTSHQDEMVELLSKQSVISGFATKTAPQRTALLERLENHEVTAGTNPQAAKTLTGLQTLHDKINAAAKENPWTAAQSSGVIQDAQVFDASKPDSAFSIIQQRNAEIARVDQWAGTKVSPFQPQEIVQLAKAVRTLPPEKQGPYLGKLGETIGDVDRINMVASELDKTNHPLALAMKLGTDRTTAGRAVTEFVLRGAQSLADKTVKRDDTALAGWRADIASKVRGTLGDEQAENDVIDSSYFTRAAFDQDGIEAPGFGLNKTTDQAIKLVIGQPMERSGVKTLLPRGMDEARFDQALKTVTPESLRAAAPMFFVRGQPIKPEQLVNRLTEFGMRRDGAGRYIPVSSGAFVTLDAAGTRPLRLNVQ